jgi:predicted transcriptional regulator
MARNQSPTLTPGELRLMEVVWTLGQASAKEVQDTVNESLSPPLAYNTVQTTLTIMASKGYLQPVRDGRRFIFRPMVERESARHCALRDMLSRFFHGSPSALLANLLKDEHIDETELKELRKLISSLDKE